MAKFKVNQTVYVKDLKKAGKVVAVDENGNPTAIEVEGQIIEAVGLIVQVLSLFKAIWLGIKGLFKKNR